MSQLFRIGQITNGEIYNEGMQLIGSVKDFDLDEFTSKPIEHEALGMTGAVTFPSRGLEPINAKMTMSYIDPILWPKMYIPHRAANFQLQAYVDIFDSDGLIVSEGYRQIIDLKLLYRGVKWAPFKMGESDGAEITGSVLAVRCRTSQGTNTLEYDPMNGIHTVNGQNIWTRY